MKKCIGIYLRLSQEDVDKRTNMAKDQSNSIVAQRQIIQRHIASIPSLTAFEQMEFCDDGFSGTNFERPDFQRMIALIREGKIGCVIVKDLSRFGRDYLEVGDYLEHIFPFLGVRMVSVNDHYDSDNYLGNTAGMDVAFRNLIYDYYSKDLSKKVKSGMRVKQKNGGYVSCCLYGYKVLPNQKHKMVIDPETAPIVRRVFMDIIAGKATSQIARELNAEGIPTPLEYKNITRKCQDTEQPRKPRWTHQRILEMLGNMKYTGCMVNNTRESRFIRDKVQRRTSREEWIINENTHEPIVTQEEFDAAQVALRRNPTFKRKKSKTESFPFYCAHCGHKLGKTVGLDFHFYCVTSYWSENETACQQVRWDRKDIEDVIFEALKAQISIMKIETKARQQETVSKGTQLMQKLKVLSAELEAGDTQKIQSYMDYREGRITKEDFIALRSEREKRHAELKEQIQQAESEYELWVSAESQTDKTIAIAEQASALDDEALKEVMYDAVERVNVVDRENIEIIWKFDDLFAEV